jgi:2Fe-2S ferredoxin
VSTLSMDASRIGGLGQVTVTVEPRPGAIDVPAGQTIMGAAQSLGYRWPTRCGGQGEWRVCVMEVVDGECGLSTPDAQEEAAIRSTFGSLQRRGRPLRKACRATDVGAGVTVSSAVLFELINRLAGHS